MFQPEHMRSARAAMLQAAIAAFFMDCMDDGSDELTLVVSFVDGRVVVDATECRGGQPVGGFGL